MEKNKSISGIIIKILFEHNKKNGKLYKVFPYVIDEIYDLFEDIDFNFTIHGLITLDVENKEIYMSIEDKEQEFHNLTIFYSSQGVGEKIEIEYEDGSKDTFDI